MSPAEIVNEVKASGLRGRGGAGFPTGVKWSFMPQKSDKPHYLLCNADESEPGTFKDRELIRWTPHALVEGCLIGAYAIHAEHAYIYIRGEFFEPAQILARAIEEAYEAGYAGKNVMGSGIDLDITLHIGAGAYICGEETGLMNSLEGRRGEPRIKPPFPAISGAFGKPSAINNVETLIAAAHIVQNGADWYKQWGHREEHGHQAVLRERAREAPRQLRGAARLQLPRVHLRRVRRHRQRAPHQVGDPRRLLRPHADGGRAGHRHGLRGDGRRGDDAGLRVGDHHGRHHQHREAGAPHGGLLRPRELRSVHALPRGDGVGRQDPPPHRERARHAGGPGHAAGHLGQHEREDDLRALGRRGGAHRVVDREVPGRLPGDDARGRRGTGRRGHRPPRKGRRGHG